MGYNPPVKRLLLFLVLVVGLATVASSSASQLKAVSFRMPSKNIGCMYNPAAFGQKAYLRCDILSGLVPKPKRKCDLDWTGLGMSRRGKAGPVCAGDTVYDRHARILKYGRTWKAGGFTCHSKRKGLKCSNRAGHGFFLARQRWSVH